MIDFHAHLDIYPSPEETVSEIIRRGMYVLSVTTTPSAWLGTYSLSRKYSRIKTALGLHPQIAHERISELSLFDTYINETDYVGEIGLDFSENHRTHKDVQIKAFNHILRVCENSGGKIMSIHSRRAAAEIIDTLKMYPNAGIPVLHWFSGSKSELLQAIDYGCWFSIGPAMIRSKRSLEMIEYMPKDRILTESDGPFAQVEGKSVMPWDVQKVITVLGSLWAMGSKEAEEQIYNNFRKIVSLKTSRI